MLQALDEAVSLRNTPASQSGGATKSVAAPTTRRATQLLLTHTSHTVKACWTCGRRAGQDARQNAKCNARPRCRLHHNAPMQEQAQASEGLVAVGRGNRACCVKLLFTSLGAAAAAIQHASARIRRSAKLLLLLLRHVAC